MKKASKGVISKGSKIVKNPPHYNPADLAKQVADGTLAVGPIYKEWRDLQLQLVNVEDAKGARAVEVGYLLPDQEPETMPVNAYPEKKGGAVDEKAAADIKAKRDEANLAEWLRRKEIAQRKLDLADAAKLDKLPAKEFFEALQRIETEAGETISFQLPVNDEAEEDADDVSNDPNPDAPKLHDSVEVNLTLPAESRSNMFLGMNDVPQIANLVLDDTPGADPDSKVSKKYRPVYVGQAVWAAGISSSVQRIFDGRWAFSSKKGAQRFISGALDHLRDHDLICLSSNAVPPALRDLGASWAAVCRGEFTIGHRNAGMSALLKKVRNKADPKKPETFCRWAVIARVDNVVVKIALNAGFDLGDNGAVEKAKIIPHKVDLDAFAKMVKTSIVKTKVYMKTHEEDLKVTEEDEGADLSFEPAAQETKADKGKKKGGSSKPRKRKGKN
ncbi:hypothetical protein J8273_7192 [Carpediemonas membranifera]|uniref:Uncharacterized protein n=3 Tax=Carpediemonas membranifera TaxID=201153 RepID=A0A8J6DXT0_9EUKA|nr:hypothetical protein J8273_7192 [Carpediemonas membranifera]|eukprot:KAG9390924.1 hypothetical protein J8273_7192 [Carpediemonas membranifera]